MFFFLFPPALCFHSCCIDVCVCGCIPRTHRAWVGSSFPEPIPTAPSPGATALVHFCMTCSCTETGEFDTVIPEEAVGHISGSCRPGGRGVGGGRPGKQEREGQGRHSWGKGSAGAGHPEHRSATWPSSSESTEPLPWPCSCHISSLQSSPHPRCWLGILKVVHLPYLFAVAAVTLPH